MGDAAGPSVVSERGVDDGVVPAHQAQLAWYAPVITANSGEGDLILECPENGPTSYSINQSWDTQD
jgi:hypothetical protein